MPGPRTRQTVKNRAAILEAARTVFTELGYEGASIRDIVRKSGMAAGTFYNYFPDKYEVFKALLMDLEERRRERISDLPLPGTFELAVAQRYRAYFDHALADRATFKLLARNSGLLGGFYEDPDLRAGADATLDWVQDQVRRWNVPGLDPQYVSGALVGAAWEIAVRLVARDKPNVEAAVHVVAEFVLGGLGRLRYGGTQVTLDEQARKMLDDLRERTGKPATHIIRDALRAYAPDGLDQN